MQHNPYSARPNSGRRTKRRLVGGVALAAGALAVGVPAVGAKLNDPYGALAAQPTRATSSTTTAVPGGAEGDDLGPVTPIANLAGGGAGSGGVSCYVDVRSSNVGVIGKHFFVIYGPLKGGRGEWYYRGGPGGGDGGKGSSGSSASGGSSAGSSDSSGSSDTAHGLIVAEHGKYVRGTIDYDPDAPSVRVMSGPEACGKNRCLGSQIPRINALKKKYRVLGPNSNSVARTLLARCGIPEKNPGGFAPGWGTVL